MSFSTSSFALDHNWNVNGDFLNYLEHFDVIILCQYVSFALEHLNPPLKEPVISGRILVKLSRLDVKNLTNLLSPHLTGEVLIVHQLTASLLFKEVWNIFLYRFVIVIDVFDRSIVEKQWEAVLKLYLLLRMVLTDFILVHLLQFSILRLLSDIEDELLDFSNLDSGWPCVSPSQLYYLLAKN